MTAHEPKTCVVCGRQIKWRKKWERDWNTVKYCSKSCRSRKLSGTDIELEERVLGLLAARSRGASICPGEVARAISPDSWSDLTEPVRMAARRLVDAGKVEITQRGHAVDPSAARGPIRIRLSDRPSRAKQELK